MRLFYLNRIKEFEKKTKKLNKRKNILGLLRLFIFIACIAFPISIYKFSDVFSVVFAIFFFILFLYLVKCDLLNLKNITFIETLRLINKNELNILEKDKNIYDNGQQFKDTKHQYSSDLDLFGKSSLYHYINRTNTSYGKKILAYWLLNKADIEEIIKRQESIDELTNNIDWRQQFQAFGLINAHPDDDINKIENWFKEPFYFIDRKWIIASIKVLPILLVLSIIGSFYFISMIIPILFFLINVLIIFLTYKKVDIIYKQTSQRADVLKTYAEMILHIENMCFQSEKLNILKSTFSKSNYKASKEIKKLSNIIKYFDFRLNLFYIPLNLCFFWDLHWVIAAEKFKKKHSSYILSWFKALGEFEAIISFSNLSYNNPQWIFPKITSENGFLIAEDIGHPLIEENHRVNNSITLNNKPTIYLITGSNMAGKSTFLRTIGVNTVLALAGSKVCAKNMQLSCFDLYTSMRVFDSLEQNISSFYAELQRLRLVIKAVENGTNAFFLLDEILKGTNSQDRHIGSKALINQLLSHNGIGMIATHDLELGYLEEITRGKVLNYNFDVQIVNEDLIFDYILRRGICRSLNASILMKKIGINL